MFLARQTIFQFLPSIFHPNKLMPRWHNKKSVLGRERENNFIKQSHSDTIFTTVMMNGKYNIRNGLWYHYWWCSHCCLRADFHEYSVLIMWLLYQYVDVCMTQYNALTYKIQKFHVQLCYLQNSKVSYLIVRQCSWSQVFTWPVVTGIHTPTMLRLCGMVCIATVYQPEHHNAYCTVAKTYCDTPCYAEKEISSFWWNFHHWLHWKLSTFSAACEENFIKMMTFLFQWITRTIHNKTFKIHNQ